VPCKQDLEVFTGLSLIKRRGPGISPGYNECGPPGYFQRKKKKKSKTKRNPKPFDSPAICCINPATWNLSDNPAFKKTFFSPAAKLWWLFFYSILSWQKQEYKLVHIHVIIGSQSAIPEENNRSIWLLFSVINIFYSPPF